MNPNLSKSKYLNVIPRADQSYVAYHSLFGNMTYLNESSIKLLDMFDKGMAPEERSSIFQHYRPYIEYFYNTYYLVEDGFDERAEVNKELEKREQVLDTGSLIGGVQLTVSDACNFKCKYCFVDFVDLRGEVRQKLAQSNNKLMSFETAKETIDTLIDLTKENSKAQLVVKFFGREPLTNWRLIKRIMEHYKHGEDFGINIHYAITTNGSLATPEISKTMSEYNVLTTVSIDGLAESNDKMRILKSGGPTFDQILAGIKNLHEYNAVHVFSGVITESSFNNFDTRFIDFAHQYDIREVQVLLGMQGNFINEINPDTIAQKLFDIYAYGRSLGIAVTGYWHNSLVEVFSTRKERSGSMVRGVIPSCTATGYQLSVEPSGDIFPCKAMSTHIGNISNLKEMLRSQTYRDVIMRTYSNVPDCHNCPIEGFCQGICLGNLEEKFDDIYHVDNAYCEVYRRIAYKILSSPYHAFNQASVYTDITQEVGSTN